MKSSVIIGGKSPKIIATLPTSMPPHPNAPSRCSIDLSGCSEVGASGSQLAAMGRSQKSWSCEASEWYLRIYMTGGYGESNMNFLNAECACDAIITNPPFRLASNFIERSAEKKVPFAMLTKSTFWHAEKRRRLFIDTGPMAVMAMTWRPAMSPERGQSATMDFIWTVWSSKPNKETKYIVERRP